MMIVGQQSNKIKAMIRLGKFGQFHCVPADKHIVPFLRTEGPVRYMWLRIENMILAFYAPLGSHGSIVVDTCLDYPLV